MSSFAFSLCLTAVALFAGDKIPAKQLPGSGGYMMFYLIQKIMPSPTKDPVGRNLRIFLMPPTGKGLFHYVPEGFSAGKAFHLSLFILPEIEDPGPGEFLYDLFHKGLPFNKKDGGKSIRIDPLFCKDGCRRGMGYRVS